MGCGVGKVAERVYNLEGGETIRPNSFARLTHLDSYQFYHLTDFALTDLLL